MPLGKATTSMPTEQNNLRSSKRRKLSSSSKEILSKVQSSKISKNGHVVGSTSSPASRKSTSRNGDAKSSHKGKSNSEVRDLMTEQPNRKTQPVQPSGEMVLPSLKGMDSSDPSIRRNTLAALLSHLMTRSSSNPLTPTQCLQLWRAFSVSLYMHDSKSAISVQNHIVQLAGTFGLVAESNPASLASYVDAFWETMTREWAGIDSHRMNKYLSLTRRVVREMFKCVVSSAETEMRDMMVDVLERWPLNGKERRVSDGLRLHVLDVYVDELYGALEDVELDEEEKKDLVISLRVPVEKVARSDSGAQKHVRSRAKEVLAELDESGQK